MHVTAPAHAVITPWIDPILTTRGHDPRSEYVEMFWLGVIGPSALWILRRLATELEAHPEGYRIDLGLVAGAVGLSASRGHASPFGRALARCVMFGLMRTTADGFAVRPHLPTVSLRHLQRLPAELRELHQAWLDDVSRGQSGVHLHLLALEHQRRHLPLDHEEIRSGPRG